ncbi:hypothetical protein J1N35_010891 [Gossypium stocksii]|uniref:Uncharacterized protein n=1 Tax=Gossypium stocksii TaxID=47602 RepID=A0A9D3W2H4_9ROSI|nr:hypothetical protein J1N35_010891 [Gossypium stocksii]
MQSVRGSLSGMATDGEPVVNSPLVVSPIHSSRMLMPTNTNTFGFIVNHGPLRGVHQGDTQRMEAENDYYSTKVALA